MQDGSRVDTGHGTATRSCLRMEAAETVTYPASIRGMSPDQEVPRKDQAVDLDGKFRMGFGELGGV
jgi:hypothetical protein